MATGGSNQRPHGVGLLKRKETPLDGRAAGILVRYRMGWTSQAFVIRPLSQGRSMIQPLPWKMGLDGECEALIDSDARRDLMLRPDRSKETFVNW